MPKSGRPPLEPRIVKLEDQFKRLQAEVEEMRQKFALAPVHETGDVPVRADGYRSNFDKWPDSR